MPDSFQQLPSSTFSAPVSRRGLLKGAGLTALAFSSSALLAACSGSTPSGSSTGKRTITVVQNGEAATNGPFLKAVQQFEKANPNISVKTVFIPEPDWVTYMSTLQTRLAGGSKYDAVYLATEAQLALYSKGALQPLDDFIKKDQKIVDEYYADIAPNVLNQIKKHSPDDGKTYFLQHQCNVMGVWYNKKIFNDNGIAAPSATWTWDDFQTACEQLSAKKIYGFNFTNDMFIGMSSWIYSNGSNLLSTDWKKSNVTSPEALEAAKFVRGIIEKGYAPTPGGTFDQYGALQKGTLAMYGAGIWPYETYLPQGGSGDFAIAPWPQKKSEGSPVGAGAYGVPKTSGNADAAWEFIKWMISKESQTTQILAGGAQPMRQSVLESDAYLKQLPEGAKYLSGAMKYATLIPGVPQASAVEDAIQTSWGQIIAGNVSPDAGLRTMDEAISGLL